VEKVSRRRPQGPQQPCWRRRVERLEGVSEAVRDAVDHSDDGVEDGHIRTESHRHLNGVFANDAATVDGHVGVSDPGTLPRTSPFRWPRSTRGDTADKVRPDSESGNTSATDPSRLTSGSSDNSRIRSRGSIRWQDLRLRSTTEGFHMEAVLADGARSNVPLSGEPPLGGEFPMRGTIQRRPDRSAPWRARYRGLDGRQQSKSIDRTIDAERWLRAEPA